MTKTIKYVLLIISLIIYIYNPQLYATPIAPKTLLAVPGFLCLIVDCSNNKRYKKLLEGKYPKLFFIAFLLFLWGLVTMTLNGSSELLYDAYLKYFVLWFLAIYFICWLARGVVNNFLGVCELITVTVLIESVIAFLMKLNPAISKLVNSIQKLEIYRTGLDYYMDVEDLTEFMRVVGIGNAFYFGVMTSCTLGLMACAYAIFNSRNKIFYSISYVVIAVVSFMTARTSLAISFVGILLLMYYSSRKNSLKIFKVGFITLLGLYVLYLVAFIVLPENMTDWMFAIFDSKGAKEGEASTLLKWYRDTQFGVKTFIMGDAHYRMGDYSYYKGVDVGFFRQIYYSGIIGLGLIIYYNFRILKYVYIGNGRDSGVKAFLVALFVCYVICMFKGDINFVELYLLLLMLCDFSFKTNMNDVFIKRMR